MGTALWLALLVLSQKAEAPFLVLREVPPETPSRPRPAPVITSLSDAEAQALLAPLAPLKPDAEAAAPAPSPGPPPPRGKQQPSLGGDAATAPQARAGPLTILRRAPLGEVAEAPYLAVTFSQPMVALSAHDEAQRSVPVRLVPQPPGQWRWLGVSTLLFEPEKGFAKGTEYAVEVPAGTRSMRGAMLAGSERWSFATPHPELVDSEPGGTSSGREPVMVASFNQRVDPARVLEHLEVRVGTAPCPLRLAEPAEVKADAYAREAVGKAGAGRSVAFRCTQALPADTEVTVRLPAGLPSAEGPRSSLGPEEWSFRTYGRLRMVEAGCAYDKECQVHSTIRLRLSNPVDPESFGSSAVRIEPAVEGTRTSLDGADLQVGGPWQPGTAYTLTVSDRLRDVFGQTLEGGYEHRFVVGTAGPALWTSAGPLVVLDPSSRPTFTVFSIGTAALTFRAYAVGAQDWEAYQRYRLPARGGPRPAGPPGRLVIDRQLPTRGRPDQASASHLDLAPLFPGGLGHALLIVETGAPQASEITVTPFSRVMVWVQATRIGLDAIGDHDRLTVWATSLKDGRPLADVTLELLPGGGQATTGSDGTAAFALTETAAAVLVARQGRDVALLPNEDALRWHSLGGWKRGGSEGSLYWHVFDDRHLYRPGDEVRLKGWVRLARKDRDLVPYTGRVRYRLMARDDSEVETGEVALSAFGGFDLALRLPEDGTTGSRMVELTALPSAEDERVSERRFNHFFGVEEFRRAEFEVNAGAGAGPHLAGEPALLDVEAKYYAGGALAGGAVTWSIGFEPTGYMPPGRGDFSFGVWVPWWEQEYREGGGLMQVFEGRADASGRHRLRVDFGALDPPGPALVDAWASVQDVNRQSLAANTSLLVHPSSLYVGLRTARYFVRKGEGLAVDVVVTDLDGQSAAGQDVHVIAERLVEEWVNGEARTTVAEAQECRTRSAEEAVPCAFTTREAGTYRVTATVTDGQGRRNQTQIRRWVAGGEPVRPPPMTAMDRQRVKLVPDRKEYAAGEVAEVLVQSPFFPAEGLLTLQREGVIRTERFAMAGGSHVLRIPIEDRWTPNVHVQVDLVGSGPRSAQAGGQISLPIPPRARRLAAVVTPRERTLAPGARTVVDLELRDAQGQPVEGEVAVVVVDEAVLAMSARSDEDPLESFYGPRGAGTRGQHSRDLVLLAPASVAIPPMPGAMLEQITVSASSVLGSGGGLRIDFRALALFAPSVRTDKAGRASVALDLPDSLTRYRVLAVAADAGGRFGMAESSVTARLPLMVRPSPPRFLHVGDRFELPVVVQNLTDEARTVDVAVRMAGVGLEDPAGRRVAVPAQDRVEVRFAARAERVGTARFQTAAAAGDLRDAAETSVPVRAPNPAKVFATYGTLEDEAAVLPVQAPRDALAGAGGLEIGLSSTALSGLSDAVLYLASYPFECAEQIASRVLAVAALRDVLQAFGAEGLPPAEELKAAVERDVARLQGLQKSDGGFSFWPGGEDAHPFVSVHVTHALARASQAGFAVRERTLREARGYLADIEKRMPSEWGPQARVTAVAYALDVRRRLGEADPRAARRLVGEHGVEALSLEVLGWLAPVLATDKESATELLAIRRHWTNRLRETAAGARFVTDHTGEDALILQGDRRTDAVILDALLGLDLAPADPVIPKLAQELLAGRASGRWRTTQDNVFVLLALERYFRTVESRPPDFLARAWLGERSVGERAFRGRTAGTHQMGVPLARLAAGKPEDLVLAREGVGRLYYRVGLRHVPRNPDLPPAEHGFAVERSYAAVDDPADVGRDADGTWRIRAGARVRATVRVFAPGGGNHVALVDPLPAGLEAINPALSTTERLPEEEEEDDEDGPRWDGRWFDHQALRDDRAEAFTQRLEAGVYKYGYLARATTPGRYVVPGPRVEEMYQPETFGRGASARVVVE